MPYHHHLGNPNYGWTAKITRNESTGGLGSSDVTSAPSQAAPSGMWEYSDPLHNGMTPEAISGTDSEISEPGSRADTPLRQVTSDLKMVQPTPFRPLQTSHTGDSKESAGCSEVDQDWRTCFNESDVSSTLFYDVHGPAKIDYSDSASNASSDPPPVWNQDRRPGTPCSEYGSQPDTFDQVPPYKEEDYKANFLCSSPGFDDQTGNDQTAWSPPGYVHPSPKSSASTLPQPPSIGALKSSSLSAFFKDRKPTQAAQNYVSNPDLPSYSDATSEAMCEQSRQGRTSVLADRLFNRRNARSASIGSTASAPPSGVSASTVARSIGNRLKSAVKRRGRAFSTSIASWCQRHGDRRLDYDTDVSSKSGCRSDYSFTQKDLTESPLDHMFANRPSMGETRRPSYSSLSASSRSSHDGLSGW
ncbi:hypothetical protein IAU59_005260 [Kwoniella sp. CBS 9459]